MKWAEHADLFHYSISLGEMGWESSVGIATRYWTVRESNLVEGEIFRTPSHAASYTMGAASLTWK